ncbi:MAG: hypothetical protein ABIQ44_00605, partial [Chloroflexia bacterium]
MENAAALTAILRSIKTNDALCDVKCVHPDHVLIGRSLLLPDVDYATLAGIFAALADPTRAKIVYSILHQELCTCDLA